MYIVEFEYKLNGFTYYKEMAFETQREQYDFISLLVHHPLVTDIDFHTEDKGVE